MTEIIYDTVQTKTGNTAHTAVFKNLVLTGKFNYQFLAAGAGGDKENAQISLHSSLQELREEIETAIETLRREIV